MTGVQTCALPISAVRQIGRAELVTLNGNGGQKLIVQLGGLFRFLLAHIGDVQRMAVLAEHRPIVLPAHAALIQPAAALEHTLGEDDIDLLDWKMCIRDREYVWRMSLFANPRQSAIVRIARMS